MCIDDIWGRVRCLDLRCQELLLGTPVDDARLIATFERPYREGSFVPPHIWWAGGVVGGPGFVLCGQGGSWHAWRFRASLVRLASALARPPTMHLAEREAESGRLLEKGQVFPRFSTGRCLLRFAGAMRRRTTNPSRLLTWPPTTSSPACQIARC